VGNVAKATWMGGATVTQGNKHAIFSRNKDEDVRSLYAALLPLQKAMRVKH